MNYPVISLFTYLCVACWAHLGSDYVSYMELNFVTVGNVEGGCLDKTSREVKSPDQMYVGLCCLDSLVY